jgi:polyhydroxybutyrate depolymerase
MRLAFAPLLMAGVGCAPAAGRPPAAGTEAKHGTVTESLKIGGQERNFRLVVPKAVDLAKPAPLVFAFHGMGIDSPEVMPRYTKLDELAAAKGFVLVYPEAVGRSWGLLPDKVKADLAFFDALHAHLTGSFKIDGDRVYVLGMSNGGYFAHLVGAERSKTVAAVMSHSGPLGLQTLGGVNAARKFPVMIVHGDRDRLLPVEWARENRDKYTKEGHEVRYVEVPGLGHAWATGENINQQLWAFFVSHPRRKD